MSAPAGTEIATVAERDLAEIRRLTELQISSPTEEAQAIDGLAFIQVTLKGLEKSRRSLVDPLNAKVKEVNASFKVMTDPIAAAEQRVKLRITDWRQRERERIAKEQARIAAENAERERKAREETERLRREEEERVAAEAKAAGLNEADAKELAAMEAATAPTVAPVIQAAPPPPPTTVRSSLGSVTGRMVWKFRVNDPAKVPLAFKVVDETLIRRAVAEGAREIPGVEIYQEEQIAGRR